MIIDVYMSILQCDIFWWKLIDRNFFNPIFNTKVVLRTSPLFAVSSSVLKPKYSLSNRNKCVYLLESSETSIAIWHQEYPQNCYI